ncbi:hypothetical protein [Nocardioides salsibiostraticola]
MNEQLRQLQHVRRHLVRGEVDVLVLGDSTCLTAAAHDTDRSMIDALIARETGGVRVVSLAAPGFSALAYVAVLRWLETLSVRPQAVVVSTVIRTTTSLHVREHPLYHYETFRQALVESANAEKRLRSLGRGSDPRPAEYQTFYDLPVTTRWGGPSTIGSFVMEMKGSGPHPWPLERRRRLFDYFHGETVTPDNAGLDEVAALGRQLTEYGVPAVAYWGRPPIAHGEELYPGEFTPHVLENWRLVKQALQSDASDLTVTEPDLEDHDFEFSPNGTEHYAYAGRLKIARSVSAALHENALSAPGVKFDE